MGPGGLIWVIPANNLTPWTYRAEAARLRPTTEVMASSEAVLRADNVTLTYQDGREVISAVRAVDLHTSSGDFVGILGHSGSGKTSLLYVLSGIRPPEGVQT